jgi:hypothetical protein
VKDEYRIKYGSDEHVATLAIAREIGVSERTISYIDAVGFSTAIENEHGDSFEKKIAAYADMRVAPLGIVTLNERLNDLDIRYANHAKRKEDEQGATRFAAALHAIEQQIFARASDKPDDITAASCEKYIPALKKYHIV